MAARFSDKFTTETEPLVFDFSRVLASGETLSTCSSSASVVEGTDASPSSLLSGSPSISGNTVVQKVTAGTSGVLYRIVISTVTSASNTYTLVGDIKVVSPTVV